MLPSSPEELMEHARMVKEATGQNYLAADFAQFPIGVRLILALMWQQGANIFTEDGTATIDTEEARKAVEAITQLFDEDLANSQLNYADSQQAFLNGEAAVLVNGTWVVDLYTSEAAKDETGLNTATFDVRLVDGFTTEDVLNDVRGVADMHPEADLTFEAGQATALGTLLGGSEADVAVRIRGEDLSLMMARAGVVRGRLAGISSLGNVDHQEGSRREFDQFGYHAVYYGGGC